MLRIRLSFMLLALVISITPATLLAQAKAQLPYSTVHSYLELFESLAHLDRIVPSMIVLSVNPDVAPQDITFRVNAEDGWKSFSPDQNGVIEFPRQPEWDQLTLISDQPKGTLQLIIGFKATPLQDKSTTYQELMSLVPQFSEAMAALAEQQGQPAPEIKGMTIQMPEGSGAAITISAKKRKTVLKSSKVGMIIMKYNQALWDENPPVEFDEIPVGIVPLQ